MRKWSFSKRILGFFRAHISCSSIDQLVGRRLRSARERSGVSTELAAALIGVPSDIFLRFEAGTKRVSAQQLFALAKKFEVPVEHFFRNGEAAS